MDLLILHKQQVDKVRAVESQETGRNSRMGLKIHGLKKNTSSAVKKKISKLSKNSVGNLSDQKRSFAYRLLVSRLHNAAVKHFGWEQFDRMSGAKSKRSVCNSNKDELIFDIISIT